MKALTLLTLLVASYAQSLVKVETLGLTLFQTFFDNLTTNFVNPLIMSLTERPPADLYVNQTLDIVDFMSFEFNLTQFKFTQSDLNPIGAIVQLGNDSARFQIDQLTINVEFDYAYISNPPLFADIGTGYLGFDGMTLDFEWTSTYDGELVLQLSDLEMNFAPDQPHPLFDGISDFSILASNMATTVAAIVRNRLVSLVNSQLLTPKLNTIANRITKLFPAMIPIGPLDLEGFLAGNPTSTPEYTHLPMSTYVTSELYPYNNTCNVTLPQVVPTTEYEIELQVTDCFVNNLLYEFFYEGWLELSIQDNYTSTTTVGKLIGQNMFSNGYAEGYPCIFHLFGAGNPPTIDLNKYGSELVFDFDMQMLCNKATPGDDYFYQVATL
jgi:hypothetical protein